MGGSKILVDGDCSHEIKRRLLLERKVITNLNSILKSRDITLSTKVRLVKAMVSPVDHILSELSTMTHLSWVALHCKEIQPVHPKGDQSWMFIGRTDVDAETPIL